MNPPYKNIQITFEESASKDYRFCADFSELPGSPSVGYGATQAEAIGNLILGHPNLFTFSTK